MFKKKINRTRGFLETTARIRDSGIGGVAFYELDTVDNKTAALLTHVSIIIAVISVIWSITHASLIRSALLLELTVYLIITLGCLRSIFIISPSADNESEDRMIDVVINEVNYRITAYKYSVIATFITTIAFILTVTIKTFITE